MLVRYLTSSKHIYQDREEVHHKAFARRGQERVSVFRINGWMDERIVATGCDVARRKGARLHGWGSFPHDFLHTLSLAFEQDDQPLEGHGHITGWPESRAASLDREKRLAKRCQLTRFDPPLEVA